MNRYLRQKDDISAKVQFHGCFKSFNETLGNMLKVHFTYISISTYSTMWGGGWALQRSMSLKNKCKNFQNTENTR